MEINHNPIKSKRFWTAFVGLLIVIISGAVPDLAEHLELIANTVVIIIGILIGGFTVTDVAQTWQDGQ